MKARVEPVVDACARRHDEVAAEGIVVGKVEFTNADEELHAGAIAVAPDAIELVARADRVCGRQGAGLLMPACPVGLALDAISQPMEMACC